MNLYEYQSPFGSRYGNPEILSLWSTARTRSLWRICWAIGIPREKMPRDFMVYTDKDYRKAQRIEQEVHHDVVAELRATQDTFPEIAQYLHIGYTSSDVVDYATLHQLEKSLFLVTQQLGETIETMVDQALHNTNKVMLGRTHLLPAEPTTWGYRVLVYAFQLLQALRDIQELRLPEPSIQGAVGTGSNQALINVRRKPHILRFQTYPRQYEHRIAATLANIGLTVYNLSATIRFLISYEELSLTSDTKQVGSSAMPHKRNPIRFENICGLARRLPGISREIWDAGAHSLLERTLDDSPLRRALLPEMFIIVLHILEQLSLGIPSIKVSAKAETNLLLEWRSWAGSRVQTLLAEIFEEPIASEEQRNRIERSINQPQQTWQQFVIETVGEPLSLDELLSIDHLKELVKIEGRSIRQEAEDICKHM